MTTPISLRDVFSRRAIAFLFQKIASERFEMSRYMLARF
jgi:hypothetical protein